MISLIAHVVVTLRRRKPAFIGRYYWAYCAHRSHTRGLRCWRWFVYDGYCAHHNATCYTDCEK